MAKFTLLIANYNNGRFFQECFHSIVNQTETDFTAIILDDCSTDNSVEIIRDIIKDDQRFKLFENDKNEGVGFTKRKLVELSNSEIVGFIDPDDAVLPNALEIMLKAHSDHKKIGLIYSNYAVCDEKLIQQKIKIGKQVDLLDENYYNLEGEISHFATFKKSIYLQTSGINPYFKIAEDKDWYMKMCEVAPVKYINEVLYLYRVHDGGISNNKNAKKALFWHFVALINMGERRNIDVSDAFFEKFSLKGELENELKKEQRKFELLKKSRLLKLLYKIGLFKNYEHF